LRIWRPSMFGFGERSSNRQGRSLPVRVTMTEARERPFRPGGWFPSPRDASSRSHDRTVLPTPSSPHCDRWLTAAPISNPQRAESSFGLRHDSSLSCRPGGRERRRVTYGAYRAPVADQLLRTPDLGAGKGHIRCLPRSTSRRGEGDRPESAARQTTKGGSLNSSRWDERAGSARSSRSSRGTSPL
jgi:hypothetical protein